MKKENKYVFTLFKLKFPIMELGDIEVKLKNLEPKVKKKALEIAKKQRKEHGLSEKEAVEKGIALAEEWYYNLGG